MPPALFFSTKMKTLPLLLLSLAIAMPTNAQTEDSAPSREKSEAKAGDSALDELLAEHKTKEDLDKAVAKAKKQGVSEQATLEARFIFHVDRDDQAALAAMLPELLKQKDAFKLDDSAIFATEEDWKAVIEYVAAIAALQKGDKAAFKTHITEAFWLSPKQAAAFTPQIEKLRMDEAMQGVKIDFADKFMRLQGGEATSLKTLLEGKKALVFHFWSPSSPECEAGMPDYATTAKPLEEKGIAMVSILPETSPETLQAAVKMIAPLGAKPPGAWILDRKEKPLARELRVRTLPVFVLVSNDGKVLFNGDPSEEKLWRSLRAINANISRPMSEDRTE